MTEFQVYIFATDDDLVGNGPYRFGGVSLLDVAYEVVCWASGSEWHDAAIFYNPEHGDGCSWCLTAPDGDVEHYGLFDETVFFSFATFSEEQAWENRRSGCRIHNLGEQYSLKA